MSASSRLHSIVLDPRAPLLSARAFIKWKYTICGERTLHYQKGQFFVWTSTHYEVLPEDEMRTEIYRLLGGARRRTGDRLVAFNPTKASVNNLLDALKAECQLASSVIAPEWLSGSADPRPSEIISVANGLLHLPTGRVIPHTPRLFNRIAVEFAFDPKAPSPSEWLRFLDSLWPGDSTAVATLQEIVGYLLTPDTSQQKAFLILGPKRSGKGTLGRVIGELLGKRNVVNPTLSSLATQFGRAPLIGKSLALVPDARLSIRTDQQIVGEHLLSITGEDAQTIDRKFQEPWNGKLPTRFLILANEMPSFTEVSGALSSRFIMLILTRSFYGNEDLRLHERLLAELQGILNWALHGRMRLSERGFFVQPASSREALDEFEDLTSPIGQFIRERCVVERSKSVKIGVLFQEWVKWCSARAMNHSGTAATFGRDLRSAMPRLKVINPRSGNSRTRWYQGIGLR